MIIIILINIKNDAILKPLIKVSVTWIITVTDDSIAVYHVVVFHHDYIDLSPWTSKYFLCSQVNSIKLSYINLSSLAETLQGRIVSACNGNRLLGRASFRCVVNVPQEEEIER